MTLIIILIVVLFFMFWIKHRSKKIKDSQITLITGAPKTCKSALTIKLATKKYKSIHFKWKIKTFFQKLFNKPLDEEPLLYCNIPLSIPYVQVTPELLLRVHRFRFKSVVILDEFYTIADSMSFGSENVDDSLSLFFKMIGHELHGGALFLNTQNVKDCHFSAKRCCTSYLYIDEKKSLPFFMKLRVRELVNSDEVPIYNTLNDDTTASDSFKDFYFNKSIFKVYDPYCYRELTDTLPIVDDLILKNKHLTTSIVLSLKQIVKDHKLMAKQNKTKGVLKYEEKK